LGPGRACEGIEVSVEHTILRCLKDKPAHGYELQRALRLLKSLYPLNNVNVYPVLRELEKTGFVHSTTEIIDSRARKIYELTPAGLASLDQWLASRPETLLPKVADPLMLRLVLMNESGGELEWLHDAIAELAAEYADAVNVLEERSPNMTPIARVAVEELVTNLERRRAFLERILALGEESATAGTH
jgi:DNA-binding PadR family transcriptional regulator